MMRDQDDADHLFIQSRQADQGELSAGLHSEMRDADNSRHQHKVEMAIIPTQSGHSSAVSRRARASCFWTQKHLSGRSNMIDDQTTLELYRPLAYKIIIGNIKNRLFCMMIAQVGFQRRHTQI